MPFYVHIIPRHNSRERRYLGVFPNEKILDEWYETAKRVREQNTNKGKYLIERVSPEWYTLPEPEDVRQFIDDVQRQEMSQFQDRCFWTLLDDVGGRQMPIVGKQRYHQEPEP
ncbi:uncharacterized protein VTP21DRAFT_892 [Calcarisporiella thermophila]|uniref:uncharacterized protein n=1 Tax=Calcarisporiella thermophila TaxID=911321 RepID=UPI003742F415